MYYSLFMDFLKGGKKSFCCFSRLWRLQSAQTKKSQQLGGNNTPECVCAYMSQVLLRNSQMENFIVTRKSTINSSFHNTYCFEGQTPFSNHRVLSFYRIENYNFNNPRPRERKRGSQARVCWFFKLRKESIGNKTASSQQGPFWSPRQTAGT